MSARFIRLRYPARCASCAGELAPTTPAWWDAETKAVRCERCDIGAAPRPAERRRSVAGGSALRKSQRLKANRQAKIRARHPRLGGLILALSDEPQTTKNWATGAEGERKLGAGLDRLAEAGVVSIHDRLRPGTTANIDHLAVAPSGVWVIDAKRYKGQVAKKDVGGWFSGEVHLYVGRRDCMKLVDGMAKQVDAVRAALGQDWGDVPVRPMLCVVDAEWGWFAHPFELEGVLVTKPAWASELLARPGPYAPTSVDLMAARLEQRLRPAS